MRDPLGHESVVADSRSHENHDVVRLVVSREVDDRALGARDRDPAEVADLVAVDHHLPRAVGEPVR